MKTKDQVRIEGKPAFYAVLLNDFKKAALEYGYALAIHGSMHRDLDLMAMPWVEDARSPDELVKALDECLGNTVWKGMKWKHKSYKPHGRITYQLSMLGDWYIDLSVMPLAKPPKMIVYTVAFIFNVELDKVLLIKKKRPSWQEGFLNGVGGKCEPNEPPLKCIEREVQEECGLHGNKYEIVGKIKGVDYLVYVYNSIVSEDYLKTAVSKTDEEVAVYDVNKLHDENLLPSVKYLIPMAMQQFIDPYFMSFTTKYE